MFYEFEIKYEVIDAENTAIPVIIKIKKYFLDFIVCAIFFDKTELYISLWMQECHHCF